MTGLEFLVIVALPLMILTMAGAAVYVHGRADDASRRADAEAERAKG